MHPILQACRISDVIERERAVIRHAYTLGLGDDARSRIATASAQRIYAEVERLVGHAEVELKVDSRGHAHVILGLGNAPAHDALERAIDLIFEPVVEA